ncbi:basic region/leucine zipper motif protein 49 [Tasmannia lanceolata]|uniref:basic region/leucine zipper motif protein 49 n=1 Tax=Tasmannia lanceolata TaxID=3420 RepID=UPI0040639994
MAFQDPISNNPNPLETDLSNPNFAAAFESLPLPSLDCNFPDDLSIDLTFPEGFMSDLNFEDDFDFSLEDLLLPYENDRFPDSSSPDSVSKDGSGVSSLSHVSFDRSSDHVVVNSPVLDSGNFDVARVLNLPKSGNFDGPRVSNSPESGNFEVARILNLHESGNSDVARVLNLPESGNSDVARVLNSPESGNFDVTRASNSSVSGNFDGARILNSPSPESGNSEHCFSGSVSSSLDSSNSADQKIKSEEETNRSFLKRKKEKEDANPNPNPNPRSSKFCRSISPDDVNSNSQYVFQPGNEEDEKKNSRLMRNRESAQLSRQRKKHYVEELEDKMRLMHSTITELNSKISFIMAENASLRQQLGGGGVGVCLPTGMYPPPPPIPPMHYPWIPCSSYALKPQGSQVPLLPIPRLKPKQPVSSSKAKKTESKKARGETKKVASVSFMGLLFFLLIFGGLVPLVNIMFGGSRDSVSGRESHGRVLTVTGHLNGSGQSDEFGLYSGKMEFGKGKFEHADCTRGRAEVTESEVKQKERGSWPLHCSDEYGFRRNDSEPLLASLYVPRNDKLVKIDGNLIIHSVLASEKAVAFSRAMPTVKSDKATMPTVKSDKATMLPDTVPGKTGLAIAGNVASALAVSKAGIDVERHSHLYRNPAESLKALASSSEDTYKDSLKSAATDGPLQQWFREGLAGPILSSGMCTEVFQFEVANPGSIIPATSVANSSAERPPNSTHGNMKNRRILNHPPIQLAGPVLNRSQEHAGKPSGEGNFQGNKTASSMVVSVLVDPREAGVEVDGMISSKSLSQIFVVVLLDSVKYVTYSCVLPFKGAGPHLVTA